MSRRLTKRQAETMIDAVTAAGDDAALVRAAIHAAIAEISDDPSWRDHVDRATLSELFDLAARLNELREL